MTYAELYKKAIATLNLNQSDIEDYRPACELFVEQLNGTIPNAIIIWLKTGEKIIFVDESTYTHWISTKEQFPSNEQRVLVSLDGEVNIAYRDLKEWVDEEENEHEWHIENFPCTFSDDDIEAWQPLPSPYPVK